MTMSDETWKWEAAELNNKERIAEMLEANWKQNETARELGISASAVCQAVKKVRADNAENEVAWSES